jgi:transposase InsO family protein
MKGSTMLATMQSFGTTPSFRRPSVSDDNAFAESLFRHLKYAPTYPRHGFGTIEEARAWVDRFVHWYNHEHAQRNSPALHAPPRAHDRKA